MASFDSALTARTAENMRVLPRGAILATGPRTVTGRMMAAWPWVKKHWSAYGNVLRRARVNTRVLGRILFGLIIRSIAEKAVIELVVDESLVRRYGPYVVGVGMHRDAVRSSHARQAVTPGHKWVILSVVIRLPYVHRPLALPLLSVLYTTKKHAKRNRAKRPCNRHRTVGRLTELMVRMVVRWAPERRFRLIGDGSCGTHDLADAMNPESRRRALRGVSLVSRFHMDAALYGPPVYSGRGRHPVKGERLPTPDEASAGPRAKWERAEADWYGGARKEVRPCSGTGLWYKCGNQAKRVRWVVVRDPEGKRRDEVFFTTEMMLTPKDIVECFVRRWSLETTFQEARAHLGLETMRNRASLAVRRSAPLLSGVYSLVVVWFAAHVRDPDLSAVASAKAEEYKQQRPWHTKRSITFSDMLAAARRDILREVVFPRPGAGTCESFLPARFWEAFNMAPKTERRRA